MPDLESALEELRLSGTRPPSRGASVERVVALAERRRRTQRAMGSVAVVLLLGVGVAVGVQARDGRPSGPATPSSTASTTSGRGPGLVVRPDTGLMPNDTVGLYLSEPLADAVVVAQCASEAAMASPEQWCEIAVPEPESLADEDFRVVVHRVISTSEGLVDCAERAERCVIGVRSAGADHLAPISFAPDLPALEPATISVERATPDVVSVVGSGFEPGTEVRLSQCRPAPDQAASDPIYEECDAARSGTVVADSAGGVRADVTVYRDVFEAYTGWSSCEPCQLQARPDRAEPAAVAVDASAGSADRPLVEIVPDGPYRPGQVVELHGRGFRPGLEQGEISIGWCWFGAQEVFGAGSSDASCSFPHAGFGAQTDQDGAFVISDFPMPGAAFGAPYVSCADPTVRCGLAWHPGEGSLPVFVTEFQLSP